MYDIEYKRPQPLQWILLPSGKGGSSMDIEMIRLKSEVVALETLVVALTRSLASWQPSLATSLQATADELRQRYRHLPIRDSSPETVDLVASEFQQAWERLMQLVLRPS